ncbi:hypothetical protein AB0300_12705 [Microbacterium sp. NPDC078814]|uniref:hypothetical protein n=1 Tax=Microbacterium sp. NPDC078814 TaxID=3154767 RepID=UPI00344CFD86
MGKRLHIYLSDDVRRSVEQGVEVRANCGRRKTLTAADIDKAAQVDWPGCKKCLAVVAAHSKDGDVTLVHRSGWEALRQRTTHTSYRFTMRLTSSGSYVTDWPLAG